MGAMIAAAGGRGPQPGPLPGRTGPGTAAATRIDVGHLIDAGPWAPFQRRAVLLAALTIIVVGFDSQLIGFAIPSLGRDWNLTGADFAPTVAAGLLGMALGSLLAGRVGDRAGRRRAILVCVTTFGAATAVAGLVDHLGTLAVLRFVTGLGIGGALPATATLAAEFAPRRHRTLVVTATVVCVPLGGMIAGLVARLVLPDLEWHGLFLIGGGLTLAFALVLRRTLPESPRFLARHPERWDELARMLDRLGRPVPSRAVFVDPSEQRVSRGAGFRTLFTPERRRDTVGLCAAFFFCLLAVYSAFSWLPTMLIGDGLDEEMAGAGLTAYNLGGVVGALLCAVAISRFGSRRPQVLCCLGAALTALLLRGDVGPTMLIVGFGLHGLFVNAVQTTLYVLSLSLHPTGLRASGAAMALGVGRLGAVLSALLGAAVIAAGGIDAFLAALAASMLGAGLSLLLMRRAVPPLGGPSS
ncbi:MFS transporter [uncultured Methylobacterium sp.]|jgi:AAHS family 4-hydroxybenzoate transporter-like MFS transporter|uniref:MFS transporter n=1 Tax=uncultured Methylobacterium sp. TaxID=157278 RepID=UPI0026080FED|nr:MFS transporter [uncultured Methylobacterium sp.]